MSEQLPKVSEGPVVDVYTIKETKEALDGLMQMSMVLALVLKDGTQIGDIATIFEKIATDSVLRGKIQAAFEGMGKIPDEITHITVQEGMELAMMMLSFVPQFIAILGKKVV